MKKITILSPCYNEADNVIELISRINSSIAGLNNYIFEILIIDNKSTDGTQDRLRLIANQDNKIKVIFNTRNFGHIRSPYYGFLKSDGDAVIYLASDLQDPPEMIPEFINLWEQGNKLVLAVKPESQEGKLMHFLRRGYYRLLNRLSSCEIVKDSTGFGLYDKVIIDTIREINDPYPFLRGLISELGYQAKLVEFNKPRRLRGFSKNNLYTLYDIGILGIISHSIIPIRIFGFLGVLIGLVSICAAVVYLFLKLSHWDEYPLGSAPLIIGLFFFQGVVLIFLSLLGEYIGSVHTYVKNRPVVVEEERLNF